MRSGIALAAALCVLALAGCSAPERDLSAMDAVERADPEAMQWAEDAVLVHVLGVEAHGINASLAAQLAVPEAALEDRTLGDGRAKEWYVMYYSPASGHRLVLSVTAGGVEDKGDAPVPGLQDSWQAAQANREGWTADSPDVAERLQEANATFAMAIRSGPAHGLYGYDFEHGTWVVYLTNATLRLQASLDGDGESLDVNVHYAPGLLPPPPPVAPPAPIHKTGSTTASLDPLNLAGEPPCSTPTHQCDETPFTLNATFTIEASLSWTVPANDYDFYVFDEGGTPLLQGASDFTSAGQTQETLSGELGPGEYRIVVVPWGGVADTFTLEAVFE